MTREELFIDYTNLAYKIANKYVGVYPNEREDIYQVALMGLWKATEHFDENRGYAFSTFATRVITNEIFIYFRHLKKNSNTKSIYTPIADNLCVEDVLKDENDYIEEVEECIDLIRVKEIVDKELEQKTMNTKIIQLLMSGYTQGEVAKIIGVTQPHISRIKAKEEKRLQQIYNNQMKRGAINVS